MRAAVLMIALAATSCGPASAPPTNVAPPPASSASPARTEDDRARAAVASLVGTTPPEWHAERWMSSPPLTLASLRGQPVLVRWWTAGCPFCSATAPSLRAFHDTYGPRGLRIIGMYHHKEEAPFDPKVYEDTAKKYGFSFPVAFDPEWKTFWTWMRDGKGTTVETGFTSVTFLLDRHGVIRHVHPGGSYVAGEPAYLELERMIETLLEEPS